MPSGPAPALTTVSPFVISPALYYIRLGFFFGIPIQDLVTTVTRTLSAELVHYPMLPLLMPMIGYCSRCYTIFMDTKKNVPKTVDAYIHSFPKELQDKLNKIRKAIKKTAPDAEEKISYQMPGYSFHGMLIYFAAWKKHIGMYPITTETEKSIPELSAYKTSGKGTVHFPLDKQLPLALIKKIVKHRMMENLERKEHTY